MCLSLTITVDLGLLKQGFPICEKMASHFTIQPEAAFVSQTVLYTFICLCVVLWIHENSSEDYDNSVHTYVRTYCTCICTVKKVGHIHFSYICLPLPLVNCLSSIFFSLH